MKVMNDLVVDRGPNPYLTNLLIKCNGRPMTTVQGDGKFAKVVQGFSNEQVH